MSGINNPQDGYVNITTSGQGYLILPWIYPTLESASNSGSYAANIVYGMQVMIPFQITIATFNAWVRTNIAGSHAGFGLYDLAGNKLVAGTVSGATTGLTSAAVTGVVIAPGTYLYCWTISIGTLKLSIGGGMDSEHLALMNGIPTAKYNFTAANASVAGALPSTLGALTQSVGDGTILPLFCVCTP